MTYIAELKKFLEQQNAEQCFFRILDGEEVPPLTDYHIQRLPAECQQEMPREMADGKRLLPIFKDSDMYTIYAVEIGTNCIHELDLEEPWPPMETYQNWDEFKKQILQIFEEADYTDEIKAVRDLLCMT